MDLDLLNATLNEVEFKEWAFITGTMGDGFYLQASFEEPDTKTGQLELQKGRKWYISSHAIVGEVVKTAFLAVMQAMEHEIRETFTWKGKRLLGPHIDIEALAAVADTREGRG